MSAEKLNALDGIVAGLIARPESAEEGRAEGVYVIQCFDSEGNLKWDDRIENLIVNTGKNWMLDNALNASATSATNVYMGLVNGGTTPTIVATDTMASHSGWTELNISASSGARQSVSFNSAATGAKSSTSAVAWSITSAGTVAGCFIALGSTAVTTNGSTAGTLFSAGTFTGGNRVVANGDTLNVSYSVSV